MPRSTRRSESAEGLCPVCSEQMEVMAVGMCDHPVCYICLTRMRVLCDQSQCAICRLELPKVIFIKKLAKYSATDTSNFLIFRKHKIYFENENIQNAFYELLDHTCQLCTTEKKKFRTFNMLQDHMRREHQMFYCDLCVNHLRSFSHERKFYDRQRLGLHRRVGDEDDKSHKGHPLCEFCDERFLDNDELVRHLRKEHYFCHFCDADGITNQFYSEYLFLREHFKESHYLCEEEDCMYAEFTNAFRSDIDMKAHIAADHTNHMKKSQARQARTLDIGFNLAPRPGAIGSRRDRDRDRDWDRDRDRGPRDRGRNGRGGRGSRYNNNNSEGPVITGDDYEEVHHSNQARGGSNRVRGGRNSGRGPGKYRDQQESRREEEELAHAIKESERSPPVPQNKDFPSLDGRVMEDSAPMGSDHPEPKVAKPDPAIATPENMATHVARSNNFSIDNGMAEDDFPSLGGLKESRANGDGNKAWAFKPTQTDFPALGEPKNKPVSSTWQSKPAPAPSKNHHGPVQQQRKKAPKSAPISKSSRAPPSLSSIGSVLLTPSSSSASMTSSAAPVGPSVTMVSSKPAANIDSPQRSRKVFSAEVDDFPSLGSGANSQPQQTVAYGGRSLSVSKSSKKSSQQTVPSPKSVEAMFDEEFPTLGGPKHGGLVQDSWAAPSASKPKQSAKSHDSESAAMRKLLNQQKKLEKDWFDLPEPEEEPMPPKVNDKPKKQEQLKKSSAKQNQSSQPKSSTRKEEMSFDKSTDKSSNQKTSKSDKSKKTDVVSSETKPSPSPDKKNKKRVEKLCEDAPTSGTESRSETENWEMTKPEKKQKKKVEKYEDDFPTLGSGKSATDSSASDQWQPAPVEKAQDKKKKKKEEKFEDEFPTLGGKSTAEPTINWGRKDDSDSSKKNKKKNKKEKNEANKEEVENVPSEPSWGYIPDFTPTPVVKEKPRPPPGIIYKENKEPRDKNLPWGNTTPIMEDQIPSLFKVQTEGGDKVSNDGVYGNLAGALKDQSNLSLASLTANMKGFSVDQPPAAPLLPAKVDSVNVVDDFPVLAGGGAPGSTPIPKPPPGLGFASVAPTSPTPKPPPGFGVGSTTTQQPVLAKPPPGFTTATAAANAEPINTKITDVPDSTSNPTPAQACQPPANLPSSSPEVLEYAKPPQFMDRNISLISAVQHHLCDNDAKFLEFKKSSGTFRQGRITATEYYSQCNNIIGADGFREIFSELLALLPDISKQHELLAAHNAARQPKRGMTTQKEKAQRRAWSKMDMSFSTCPTCRQVLLDRDVADHSTEHNMDNDFPTLGIAPANPYGFSAWRNSKVLNG